MWADDCFRGQFSSKLVRIRRAEHVSHSCNAVRNVERICGLVVPRVHVHIPESWDQVFVAAVHDLRARHGLDLSAVLYIRDPITRMTTVWSRDSVPVCVSITVT